MTDRKANILARIKKGNHNASSADKVRLHMLASEEPTIRDKPKDEK